MARLWRLERCSKSAAVRGTPVVIGTLSAMVWAATLTFAFRDQEEALAPAGL
jgi:hypothetical protein